MNKFYNHADILLLSLKSGKFGSFTIPGKFQTYLKVGKPILCHASGEVNKLILVNKLGYSSPPGQINLLINNIKKILYLKKKNFLQEYSKVVKKNSKLLLKKFSEKISVKKISKILQLYKKTPTTIKMILNVNKLFKRKNFIYSALNLAFLGSYSSRKFQISDNFYVWPDGIFGVNFMKDKNNVKKISGRKILKKLLLPKSIKEIIVIGNLPKESKKYLSNKFQAKNKKLLIKELKLPYGNIDKLRSFLPKRKIRKDQLIILTLPTPKQEQIATYLSNYNKNYKILCLGGAINMLAGLETPVPKFLEKYFEGMWRLQYDPVRRVRRLIYTLGSFLIGKINKKFRNLNKELIRN